MTPQTYEELHYNQIIDMLRDLDDGEILTFNRAVLQVMFERDIAGGALEAALEKVEEQWESSFKTE
jgi:hypothetical protein